MKKSIRCGIYLLQNVINLKVYIGSSKVIFERRDKHLSLLRKCKHPNIYLQRAFNKYCEGNFRFYVLYDCAENQLLKWEQFFIDRFDSANKKFGYNICPNAASTMGKKMSKETRQKISLKNKGRLISPEVRQKISNATKGEKNPFFGKSHTWQTKQKISRLNMGRNKGIKRSSRIRQKISNGHNFHKKSVLQFDKDGNFLKEYESISQAGRQSGIPPSHISMACRKRLNFGGCFIWKYKNALKASDWKKKDVIYVKIMSIKKPVFQYDANGLCLREYTSILTAEKETGIRHISECCRGKANSCGGFLWRYKNTLLLKNIT